MRRRRSLRSALQASPPVSVAPSDPLRSTANCRHRLRRPVWGRGEVGVFRVVRSIHRLAAWSLELGFDDSPARIRPGVPGAGRDALPTPFDSTPPPSAASAATPPPSRSDSRSPPGGPRGTRRTPPCRHGRDCRGEEDRAPFPLHLGDRHHLGGVAEVEGVDALRQRRTTGRLREVRSAARAEGPRL